MCFLGIEPQPSGRAAAPLQPPLWSRVEGSPGLAALVDVFYFNAHVCLLLPFNGIQSLAEVSSVLRIWSLLDTGE